VSGNPADSRVLTPPSLPRGPWLSFPPALRPSAPSVSSVVSTLRRLPPPQWSKKNKKSSFLQNQFASNLDSNVAHGGKVLGGSGGRCLPRAGFSRRMRPRTRPGYAHRSRPSFEGRPTRRLAAGWSGPGGRAAHDRAVTTGRLLRDDSGPARRPRPGCHHRPPSPRRFLHPYNRGRPGKSSVFFQNLSEGSAARVAKLGPSGPVTTPVD
jgi:hypothetical protein